MTDPVNLAYIELKTAAKILAVKARALADLNSSYFIVHGVCAGVAALIVDPARWFVTMPLLSAAVLEIGNAEIAGLRKRERQRAAHEKERKA